MTTGRLVRTAALSAACLAAATAAPPASQPAPDAIVSLGNDLVRFHAPPSPTWAVRSMGQASADKIYFEQADHRSVIEFELTPADYPLAANNTGAMAAAVCKALKDKRQHDGTLMLLPPTVEKDRRLDVVVHERYKAGDAAVDALHLWKLVGPRTVMGVASSVSVDPGVPTATFAAAKDALASAKYNRQAARRPR